MTEEDKIIKGKNRGRRDSDALQQIFVGGEDIWPKVSFSDGLIKMPRHEHADEVNHADASSLPKEGS
jgi:hypothetical protein